MKPLILALLILAAALPAAAELATEDAWIRLPPPGMRTAAGYVALENTGSATLEITGATSDAFGGIMLHETVIDDDGRSRMQHLGAVTIKAGGSYRFKPNGPHLMLFDPVQPLVEDREIEIRFETADGTGVPVIFTVRRPGR